MYVESKARGISGPARIGRVQLSKTGKSLTYRGRTLRTMRGKGYKANYVDVDTGEEYWVSGPRKDGLDRPYPGTIEIDDDVREEYWTEIRGMPERAGQGTLRSAGKYRK